MKNDKGNKLFWHKYAYPERPSKMKHSLIMMTAIFLIWPLLLFLLEKGMDSLGKNLEPIDRETIQADLTLGISVGCFVVIVGLFIRVCVLSVKKQGGQSQ